MDQYRPGLGVSDSSDEDGIISDQEQHAMRRHVAQSEDKQMLGVWGDPDDEYNVNEPKYGRMNSTDFVSSVLKPTTFVSASPNGISGNDKHEGAESKTDELPKVINQLHPDRTLSDRSDVEDAAIDAGPFDGNSESDTDSTSKDSSDADDFSLDSSDIINTEQRGQPRFGVNRTVKHVPTKPTQQHLSKEFGKFTNSTVWNMMAKMGYKAGEGLGKHGEGRVEPVQVVLRRAGEGISYSRSERPSGHDHIEAAAPGTRSKREKEPKPEEGSRAAALKSTTMKPAFQRTNIEYKTLQELQQRADARIKEVFVDMATNTQAGSLAELVAKRLPLSENEQLVRDARLGLDLSFSRLEQTKRDRAFEGKKRAILYKDIDRLSLDIVKRRKRVECLLRIKDAIKAVHEEAGSVMTGSAENTVEGMENLYTSFHNLYDVARNTENGDCGFDAWRELQLEQVVTDTMYRHLNCTLDVWTSLKHIETLADILTALRIYTSTNDGNPEAREMTPFESMLNCTVTPRLKRFIFTEWDPLSDSLGYLLEVLPKVTVISISCDIGSVLQRFVENISTRAAMTKYNSLLNNYAEASSAHSALVPLRVDRAIIPWLPFILEQTELLLSIRRKLCAALELWEPSKQSNSDIIALVLPWFQVLQGKELYRLSTKVASRLVSMLESNFCFNAQKQTTWAFRSLIAWYDVLPFDVWFSVTKRCVMSKFLDYLWTWLLQPNANYGEIADWYWQWKQMFPGKIFTHLDMENEFKKGLVYMAHGMALS
ncbi:hypothetical protein IWW48_004511 [Coemansia sp. RSA 1200]|nr:hypothetical protein IWW48_004511 [Coemansia sp. RSA 1200]